MKTALKWVSLAALLGSILPSVFLLTEIISRNSESHCIERDDCLVSDHTILDGRITLRDSTKNRLYREDAVPFDGSCDGTSLLSRGKTAPCRLGALAIVLHN